MTRARFTARARSAGRPRASATDRARSEIVRIAAQRFARQGYGATRTAEIARAAGVSEGTLFHHFPSKRALLAEVGRREGDRVLAVAFRGVDPTAAPPEIEELLRPLFAYARAEPDTYRLFAMDGDVEDLASGFAAKRTRVTSGLAAMLAGWSARGFVRRMDPDLVADLVFGLVDTAVRRLVLEERWSEHDAWLRETSRAVRSLLLPRDDSEPEPMNPRSGRTASGPARP